MNPSMMTVGERRIVDFRPLLVGKLREQLLEHDKFVQFALTDWTLEWLTAWTSLPKYCTNRARPRSI